MLSELKPSLRYPGTEHIFGLVDRFRLGWLLRHFPPLLVWTLYVFVNGFIDQRLTLPHALRLAGTCDRGKEADSIQILNSAS